LTDNIYKLIVRETNEFARQFIASHPDKEDSRYVGSWYDLIKEELKAFITTIIMMGIVHKPNVNCYWSLNELLFTPSFSRIMTCDQFKLILKFPHFNNTYNPEDPDHDCLYKVRPFLDMLCEIWNCLLSQEKPQRGRNFGTVQKKALFPPIYKTKCARFSIKLYELTTSEGITLDILVYCGKGMYYVEDDQYESMATTERIPIIKPAMIKAGRTSRPAVTCCSSTPKDL